MEHLSSFELYEYAKFRDMVKGDAFVSPKKNELSFNIRPIRKIIISDELKNNKFNIDYNTEIGVLYNDSEEHKLFKEKRLYERTPFEDIIEFNAFINEVFNILYPTYFFDTIDKLDDIDIFDTSLSQSYNKTYLLSIYNEGSETYFYIPYTLTKNYNEKTNKFEFYIYIITINSSKDETRIYQEFNFDYDYSTGEIIFIDNIIIGVTPIIPPKERTKIDKLYSEEHINFNYHKSLIKKDVTITQPIKGKTPLSSKSFSKIMKKR